MPRIGATIYDLLLSCPGDVIDLKDIIDDCVKNFNKLLGETNNIRVDLKHWSTDSFPQSGDKPQNLLNKQFIDDCDLCVALLGNRFGTPTDNYDSGTEEEIENMITNGKQVFLYFIERSVDPSTIDTEQLSKVRSFKEKYTDKGIYSVIKSEEELKAQFLNSLSLYFIKNIFNTGVSQHTYSPNLIITSQNGDSEKVSLSNNCYSNLKIISAKENAIEKLIEQINSITLEISEFKTREEEAPDVSKEVIEKMSYQDVVTAIKEKRMSEKSLDMFMGLNPATYEKAEISQHKISLINDYCSSKYIHLSELFFDLGNLQIKKGALSFSTSILGSESVSYEGSDTEKKKKELIYDLCHKLYEYKDVCSYFEKLNAYYRLSLIVNNIGSSFDEDIDVKIFIEKGKLEDINDIAHPESFFIEEVLKANAPYFLFSGKKDPDIDEYSNYPPEAVHIPKVQLPPLFSSSSEDEEFLEEYEDMIERIFCYDVLENDTEVILSFNIRYLKQNTKMFFPSFLFFKEKPTYIRYEMRSKHSPNVYSKKIDCIEYVD